MTIYDYIKENKDIPLNEKAWNKIDNLLCAIIAYIPLSSFKKKTFNELVESMEEYHFPNKYDVLAHETKKIFHILKGSKRYESLIFKNFISLADNDVNFSAITIKIHNKKIISYRGSDNSIATWLENCRIICMYPTTSQKLAIKYAKKNISIFDNDVSLIGHSRGGNEAIVSSMNISLFKLNKVKEIINYDGPGLPKSEYKSKRFKIVKKKLTNYLPKDSYIGCLLYNDDYIFIKTKATLINVHYLNYWLIQNDDYIYDKMSSVTKRLHESSTKGIDDLDKDEILLVINNIFNTITAKNVHFSFSELKETINNLSKLDSSTFKNLKIILESMLKASFHIDN